MEELTEGQKRYRKYRETYLKRAKLMSYKDRDNVYFGGMRNLVLDRDGHKCVLCAMTEEEHVKKYGRALTIDHIDGNGRYSKTKNNDLKNLRTLCLHCHGKIDVLKSKQCKNKLLKLKNYEQ